eukprot:c25187_g1_i2 orf=200-883(+)
MGFVNPHSGRAGKAGRGTRFALGLCISTLMVLLFLGFVFQWNEMLCRAGEGVVVSTSSQTLSKAVNDAGDFGILGVPLCKSRNGAGVKWTRDDLLEGLKEFVEIYAMRPIKNNAFGMGFDHSFGVWFIARWLKPDLIIESGVFKGHSTWVLRQAMPDKPIISISPRHPEKYLKKGPAYVDSNCRYYSGKNFTDFGNIQWASLMDEYGIKNKSRVLLFFDDHQSELKR